MLDLGYYKMRRVTTNPNSLTNRHIAVIGASGSGKTVECQRIMISAVEQGNTVIAIDMHGALENDQIFERYRPKFEQNLHEIDVHANGIPCALFSPITYLDGTTEAAVDLIGAITNMVAGPLHLGSEQKAELRKAVKYVFTVGLYEKQGFQAIDDALHYSGNQRAEAIRDKLYFLTSHNVFRLGDGLYEEAKINVFRLSRFDLATQTLLADMLLQYLWRLANAGFFKQKPVYVFIDECQNLPGGKQDILPQIISEGRKFGLNLILATQLLKVGTTSEFQQRIAQCGLILFFKPAAGRVPLTARMIDPSAESDWCRVLRTLKVGEFVADGNFLVDGIRKDEPLKISAREDD